MLSSGEILHATLGGCWPAKPDLRSREGNFDVQCAALLLGTIAFIFYAGALMFYLKANVITAMQTVKTVLWF